MNISTPYLFAGLLVFSVIAIFRAIWLFVPRRDVVADRLANYGATDFSEMLEESKSPHRRRLSVFERLANGFGIGPWLARSLSQSDLPLTVAEFILLMMVFFTIGFAIGSLRANSGVGLLFAILFAIFPIIYLRIAITKRLRAFNEQLPDVLALLVGALRAGYGLTQAITVLVEKMPNPAAVEFARVSRALNLGISVQQALNDMAERVNSDDLSLVTTAINVQYEVGGNLAQILDTISVTIQERVRILRDVRVLTAQQRMTSYVLCAVPLILTVLITIINPNFFEPFFEPGLIRFVPYIGILMVVTGFLMMRRIADIRV